MTLWYLRQRRNDTKTTFPICTHISGLLLACTVQEQVIPWLSGPGGPAALTRASGPRFGEHDTLESSRSVEKSSISAHSPSYSEGSIFAEVVFRHIGLSLGLGLRFRLGLE